MSHGCEWGGGLLVSDWVVGCAGRRGGGVICPPMYVSCRTRMLYTDKAVYSVRDTGYCVAKSSRGPIGVTLKLRSPAGAHAEAGVLFRSAFC